MTKKTRDATRDKARDEWKKPAFGSSEDEDLSALLDGELSPERAQQLRLRLAEEPELAARCAELGEVSGHLRNLAHPEGRSESESQLEGARVEGMHAALRERIAAEEAATGIEAPAGTPSRASAPVIPLRASWKGLVPAVAAMAAGLALYLSLGNFRSDDSGLTENRVASEFSEPLTSDLENPLELPGSTAETEAGDGVRLENGLAETSAPERAPQRIAEAFPTGPSEMARENPDRLAVDLAVDLEVDRAVDLEVDLAVIGDEELAIAFEFDVLADFDVIENLELLELLDELDTLERI